MQQQIRGERHSLKNGYETCLSCADSWYVPHTSFNLAQMILVTGATGLLGSALTRQLVESGEHVRIYRRETSRLDLLEDVVDRVEHAIGDINDPEALREAMQGVSHVYHSAAFVGFGGKRDQSELNYVNVHGTINVVGEALDSGIQRLVHVSSMAAFGRPNPSPALIDETTAWTPSPNNSAYAESKYLGEMEVHRAVAEGLDAVIVNPALIFGPGRMDENTGSIVTRARSGAKLAPAGGTCVVDVDDVAAGMRAAMARGETGERYFLGGQNLSWLEILSTLADAFGQPPPRTVVSSRMAMLAGTISELGALVTRKPATLTRETARTSAQTWRYSNRKATEELGITFRPFSETARRIAA